ncbi:hypothetical protein GCM10010430_37620 [Kitasatospora cystarginea]|uniref:Bulb-type lectin domain-containing protein n=1 Tax=Kitasatospora cystarginea TaxID=58350 RepID=A0ABN3E929_9ACTN
MISLRTRASALAAVAAIGLALTTGTANAAPAEPLRTGRPAMTAAATLSGATQIGVNSVLAKNTAWYSPDGSTALWVQDDGNVVLYHNNKPVWVANGVIPNGNVLVMQNDGNLVVYSAANAPLWSSGTAGHAGAYLAIYNDGHMNVEQNGTVLWTSVHVVVNPCWVLFPKPWWCPTFP